MNKELERFITEYCATNKLYVDSRYKYKPIPKVKVAMEAVATHMLEVAEKKAKQYDLTKPPLLAYELVILLKEYLGKEAVP